MVGGRHKTIFLIWREAYNFLFFLSIRIYLKKIWRTTKNFQNFFSMYNFLMYNFSMYNFLMYNFLMYNFFNGRNFSHLSILVANDTLLNIANLSRLPLFLILLNIYIFNIILIFVIKCVLFGYIIWN